MKTVREVCQYAGVTRKTLFYYDRIGLLKPSVRKGSQKHKLYDEEAVERLLEIRRYREAGFDIREIREALDQDTEGRLKICDAVIARLSAAQAETEKKISRAEIIRKELEKKKTESAGK